MAYQLKITLDGAEPAIWRRVIMPSDLTLYDLHFVIQTAMGWENQHRHGFSIGKQQYGGSEDASPNTRDEVQAVLEEVARPKSKIWYDYDYGDSWKHLVLVECIIDEPELAVPRCVDGARACPPEDCGGLFGYEDKLAAMASEDEDAREEAKEWLGEDFDPEHFDKDAVNRELALMFNDEPEPTKPMLSADEQRKARNKRKKQRAKEKN